MTIVLNGDTGVIVSGNTNTLSGVTVGRGAGADYSNTALGASALSNNSGGNQNIAVGTQTLIANTSGYSNAGAGYFALRSNTTGSGNVAFGTESLWLNTTASNNTAVGRSALQANTTASNNTAVGYQAGYSNTTGIQKTLVGSAAGYASTGNQVTAVGNSALTALTTGVENVAVGVFSCGAMTTGGYNTAVGDDSLRFATTGSNNVAVGYGSGGAITTGSKNTVIGRYSGNQGGLDIRTANNHIVLSDGDGNPRIITDGSGFAGINTLPITNTSLSLKYDPASQYGLVISNTSTTFNGSFIQFRNSAGNGAGQIISNGTATVAYQTSSDYRLKENIAPMTGALATVAKLKPVTYNWKVDGSAGQGFIAHELQEIVPDCVGGKKDDVDANGNPRYQGVDTSFLVATLVAAIQELKAEFDAYKASHP